MTEQEHEQHDEESPEERDETLKDLDVPSEETDEVKGGWDWRKMDP